MTLNNSNYSRTGTVQSKDSKHLRRYIEIENGLVIPESEYKKEGVGKVKATLSASQATVLAALIAGIFLVVNTFVTQYFSSIRATSSSSSEYIPQSSFEIQIKQQINNVIENDSFDTEEKTRKINNLLKLLSPPAVEKNNKPKAQNIHPNNNLADLDLLINNQTLSLSDLIRLIHAGDVEVTYADLYELTLRSSLHKPLNWALGNNLPLRLTWEQRNDIVSYAVYISSSTMEGVYDHNLNDNLENIYSTSYIRNELIDACLLFLSVFICLLLLNSINLRLIKSRDILIA